MKINLTNVILMSLVIWAAPGAVAQSSNCDYGYLYQTYEGIPLTPGTYRCDPFLPYTMSCSVKTTACRPPRVAEETSCKSCAAAGSPINLASGNTYIIQQDFALPGIGGGLSLTRTWNSKWPAHLDLMKDGMFGRYWRSTYEEKLFFFEDYLKYGRSDGSFWTFAYDQSNAKTTVNAPANEVATLTTASVTGGSIYILTFNNGTKRTFDLASGFLKSIADRNGNTTTLTYDGNSRLSTVTDAANRTITFTYIDGSSRLVSQVSSNAGTFLYAYDGVGRLIKVTRPDNTFVTFEYGMRDMIEAVKDTEGKILEAHTYDDKQRGLTSTRANGVDAITITYPPDPSGIIVTNPE